MAVDVDKCVSAGAAACGGADSSLFLTLDEVTRPENSGDKFSELAGRALIKIASFYDISASDALAVSISLLV